MAKELPEDVTQLLKDAGLPDPMWYVGSAEGAWSNVSKAEWDKLGAGTEQTTATAGE
jgi:hypothetical protein